MQRTVVVRAPDTDGVAHEPQWSFSDVTNLILLGGEKRMFSVRRDDDIEPVATKIVDGCLPFLASSCPCPLGNINAVLLDDFPVGLGRVLLFRNGSGREGPGQDRPEKHRA